MNNSEKLDKLDGKLEKIGEDVAEIRVVLRGYNGQVGLCEDHENLKAAFSSFRRKALIIFGVLVGSGVLGLGLPELVKAFS